MSAVAAVDTKSVKRDDRDAIRRGAPGTVLAAPLITECIDHPGECAATCRLCRPEVRRG